MATEDNQPHGLLHQLQKLLKHFGINVGAQVSARQDDLAIIGGGLAGLMSAFQANAMNPSLDITVYERGSEQSYNSQNDNSQRASLSASPSRTIRFTGEESPGDMWRVQETRRVIEQLQAELDAHPEDYPGLAGKQLMRPQPSVSISDIAHASKHEKMLANFRERNIPVTELNGAQLKQRFPGLYNQVADDANVIVQEGAIPGNDRSVSAVMDVEAIMQLMKACLSRRGVTFRHSVQADYVQNLPRGVEIGLAGGETVRAKHVILAPGQWLESIKDKAGNSLTRSAGIQPRYDRVLVMDIDAKALGLPSSEIPFTKDGTAGNGKGTFYSHQPDPASGHIKYMPAMFLKSVSSTAELHAPISDREIDMALDVAAKRFGVNKELLRSHTKFSSCAYTSPAKKEAVIAAPLDTNITLLGLDSSSLARSSAGYGAIAASIALSRPEPYAGAFNSCSLQKHQQVLASPPVIEEPADVEFRKAAELSRKLLGGASLAI